MLLLSSDHLKGVVKCRLGSRTDYWAGSELVLDWSPHSSSGVRKDVHLNAPLRWRRYSSSSTRASNEVLVDLFLGSGYISTTENFLKLSDGFIHCLASWKKTVGKTIC